MSLGINKYKTSIQRVLYPIITKTPYVALSTKLSLFQHNSIKIIQQLSSSTSLGFSSYSFFSLKKKNHNFYPIKQQFKKLNSSFVPEIKWNHLFIINWVPPPTKFVSFNENAEKLTKWQIRFFFNIIYFWLEARSKHSPYYYSSFFFYKNYIWNFKIFENLMICKENYDIFIF